MTEEHSLEARVTIARRFASAFAESPEVIGAAAGGSIGLGLADRYSDVDLAVVCRGHSWVPAEFRIRAYSRVASGGALELDVLGPGTFDAMEVDGIRVEVEFHCYQPLRDALAELESPPTDAWRRRPPYEQHGYAVLSMLRYWRVLSDASDALAALVRAAALPPALRRQVLEQGSFLRDPHLLYEHERACLRGDSHYALHCQGRLLDHFTQIAFALANEVYPGDKWIWQILPRLALPAAVSEGLRELVEGANECGPGLERKAELAKRVYRALVAEVEKIRE